jgi:hypothetical protein
MINRLLGCMHDVCNKLGAIVFAAKLLEKTCEKCLKRIECGGCPNLSLVSSITNSCLDISEYINKFRKGEGIQEGKSYNLTMATVENLNEIVSQLSKTSQIEIIIDNRLPLNTNIFIKSDLETDGRQFLENIFFNAHKANAKTLRIVAVDCGEYIAIHFIDDGDGMSLDKIHCLGLKNQKDISGEGTGILKKIALKEGASVEWTSAGKGSGCCVTLRLSKTTQFV